MSMAALCQVVALRKESVDRNRVSTTTTTICIASLSARRAWIEIDFTGSAWVPEFVALRKESVDRNLWWGVRKAVGSLSRSPQGERG